MTAGMFMWIGLVVAYGLAVRGLIGSDRRDPGEIGHAAVAGGRSLELVASRPQTIATPSGPTSIGCPRSISAPSLTASRRASL